MGATVEFVTGAATANSGPVRVGKQRHDFRLATL
jgi:hypothetical protein